VPHLRALGHGKIIQISGGGATSPMPGISAYAASKSAIVRFTETLALELADAGIDVNALAPGAMNTRMLDEVLHAGPDRVGQAYYERSLAQQESGGTPPTVGAELALWLASSESDGVTGKLISAVWDPWRDFEAHRDELSSDVYTLRRIIPRDRGMDWGD
jgi:3-oxoacyl-[acyl-carrier protein] reductase